MKMLLKRAFALVITIGVTASILSACAAKPASSKISRTFSACYAAKTVEELCKECVTVVHGKVSKIGPSSDVGDTVHTAVEVAVQEQFKGNSQTAKTCSYWEEGGETDTQVATPMNGALITVGQEAFFFIFKDGSRYPGYYVKDGKVTLEQFMKPDLFTSSDGNFKSISVEKFTDIVRSCVK